MSAGTKEIIARAVIRRNGHLLLARQRTKSWSFLPGGHVEPGERVEMALAARSPKNSVPTPRSLGSSVLLSTATSEDDVTHHELNLVFEVAITDAEPVSQEDHLEFRWLPLDQLADTDVRPGALKHAPLATGDDRTPFWHGWNG